jgi:hypothetical protein
MAVSSKYPGVGTDNSRSSLIISLTLGVKAPTNGAVAGALVLAQDPASVHQVHPKNKIQAKLPTSYVVPR